MEEQEPPPTVRRPRRRGWRLALVVLLLLLVVALVLLWSMRVRLATGYIEGELAERGVQATYEIRRIGFGTQVLENLVIGDPRNPDLTARRVAVEIELGLTGPEIGLVTARGVRMRGRVVDGELTLGQVDKLLPPPSGLPFRLPDQDVDVDDAAIVLDTPAGRLALGLAGRGNLADGFRGRLALVSRGLALGECRVAGPRANVAVVVTDLRPRVRGPAAAESVRCGRDLAIERPLLALDSTFLPALDGWRGETALRATRLAAGPQDMAGFEGRLTFAGDLRRTAGRAEIGSGAAAVAALRAARTRFDGLYVLSGQGGNLALNGEVALGGLTVDDAGAIAAPLRAAEGTPIGPIGAALAAATERAARGGGDVVGRLQVVNGRGFAGVRLAGMRYASRSGARLSASGGDGITWYWPGNRVRLDGDFALSGGGFPDARFALRQPRLGAAMEGVGRVGAMQVAGARLALDAIRFTARPGGVTTFRTALLADGPLAGGRVSGLTMPLAGRFGPDGFALGEGCVPVAFRALAIDQLRLGPTRLPLCPVGRALVWQGGGGGALRYGAELRRPRLAGRLGSSPLALASDRLRLDGDGLAVANLAVRLGPAGAPNRLDVAELRGRFGRGGIAGTYAGLSAKLDAVAFAVEQGAGRWQYLGGDLDMAGSLRVVDTTDPVRFNPAVSDDVRLTLADNRIHVTGTLRDPAGGAALTLATIDHDLDSGAGRALLDVPGLTFTPGGLQPEAVSPLTLGIVALVDGTVTGQGRIEWDARGTRSTGTFATAGMDLAAPFGPVQGLDTSIEFTDLLGLTSAPGQVAEMDLIQAGVDVYDGRVVYQLQPNYRVAIESARWPFAGGELYLQPTVLDFTRPRRDLTFQVVGLDAAAFIQQMEFSNIAATGTFDGVVPMQFDIRGGRIVDGRLSARPPGGNLSYVGELTDRDLGAYGILAFNALKSLRYNRFDLTLDGALDGEFITIIDLDGIARDPEMTTLPGGGGITEMIAGRVFSQVARIPFEFNIRIQGRFRSLIATARSFNDPTPLIQSVLPEMLRETSTSVEDVQNEESETVP